MLGITFVGLGIWQLSRHDERQQQNAIASERYLADPILVEVMLESAGPDIETLEFRAATAKGTFDPAEEVLIRSQVHLGNAGFHVLTPLVNALGEAVLVNRGWVPLTMDEAPVTSAPPPTGETEVQAWVHLTQTRGAFGPRDPDTGDLDTMSRVDIERIQQQIPYPLAEVYLVQLTDGREDLPVPVEAPAFDDEGPHFAYAIQWFAFALIGLIGYWFLLRRAIGRLPGSSDAPAITERVP